jgi:hypothetical protein
MHRALPIVVAILLLPVGIIIGWVAANRFAEPERPPLTNDASAAPKSKGENQPVNRRPASPYCLVEGTKTFKLDDGIGLTLTTWDIRAHGIKKLTFQILAIKDGKTVSPRIITYEWKNTKWNKDDPDRTATVAYWLRLEDGKLIPWLDAEMQEFETSGAASIPYHFDWDQKNTKSFSQRRESPGPITMAQPLILATNIALPTKDGKASFTTDGRVATVTKQTEEGGAAFVLTVEWTAD